MVEAADEGHLLQDVGLHAGNAVEEEDGEDAGGGAEGGADGAPAGLLDGGVLPGGLTVGVGGVVRSAGSYILRRAPGVYWPSLTLGML